MDNKKDQIPGGVDSSIYATFKFMSYQPWSAIGEFVDNSVDSFFKNRNALSKLNKIKPGEPELRISIEYNDDNLIIRDNAAGISDKDMQRAFMTGIPPADTTGLSEFGMGMKTAACWFGDTWTVTTSAINEDYTKLVSVDVNEVIKSKKDAFPLKTKRGSKKDHYTVLKIDLRQNRLLKGGTRVDKIKRCIAHKYRIFLRKNNIEIKFNGENLEYKDPEIMVNAPWRGMKVPERSKLYTKKKDAKKHKWEHKLKKIELGQGVSVTGTVFLRDPMSKKHAGFSIFRRNRLIEGGFEETWRPQEVSGTIGSWRYARISGELHVKGAQVTHDKTKIDWIGNQKSELAENIAAQIKHQDVMLYQQADQYRAQDKPGNQDTEVEFVEILPPEEQSIVIDVIDAPEEDSESLLDKKFNYLGPATISVHDGVDTWKIKIRASSDSMFDKLVTIIDRDKLNKEIDIVVSQTCDFYHQYGTSDEAYNATIKMIASFVTAACVIEDRKYVDKYKVSKIINIVNSITDQLKMVKE